MFRIKRHNRKNYRRGATAVEFALVCPAMFLMIFSAFEFSKIAILRSLAQCAAYESARLGVVEGATQAEALAEAERILSRLNAQGYTVDINGGAEIDEATERVEVYIEIPMEDNCFLLSQFFSGKSISADIALKTERYNGYYDASAD